jgi:hypothetical protein
MGSLHESPRPVETDPASGAPVVESEAPAEWDAFLRENAEAEAAARQSSALKYILGLAVVWGSLYLVALAQKYSYHEIRFDIGASDRESSRPASFIRNLGIRDKVMTPMDVRFHQTSARQIVKLLLSQTGITTRDANLDMISETPKTVSVTGRPLYYLLHSIIDNPQVGFALEERRAQFFAQTMKNAEPPTGLLRTFDWSADIELSSEPTLVFPSIRSDLWLIVSLQPHAVGPGPTQSRVEVEVWRGAERYTTWEDTLSENQKATLDLSAGGKVLVTIEPLTANVIPAAGVNRSKYKLRIYFEARGEGGTAPPEVASSASGSSE